jgi:N6-adenosine-specific RNA methylase IME4
VKYRTVVADPPWPMPDSGRRTGPGTHTWGRASHAPNVTIPYPTLSVNDIRSLRIATTHGSYFISDIAAASAHLYLWTTNRFLETAFDVARAWEFEPVQVLTWCKPPIGLGFGGAFCSTTEFVLFCRRGRLKTEAREDSSWWKWPRPYENGHIAHSAKPEAFLDMVERVSPSPRLELFARRNRLGWDTWGNEALEHVKIQLTSGKG